MSIALEFQEALEYMRKLPDGRRVFHCEKHQLYQEDCAACVADFTTWRNEHDDAMRAHRGAA